MNSPPTRPGETFARQGASLLSRTVFVAISGAVTGIIAARTLGATGKGTLAGLVVVPSIVMTFCDFGVPQALTVLTGRDKDNAHHVVSAAAGLLVVSVVVGFAGSLFGLLFLRPSEGLMLLVLASAPVPLVLLTDYINGVFLGLGDIRRYNRTKVLSAVGLVGVYTALMLTHHMSLRSALWAAVLVSGAAAVYSLAGLRRYAPLRIRIDRRMDSRLLKLGAMYALVLFLLCVNYKVDIIILQRYVPDAAIGQYSVAVGLAQMLWLLPTAVGLLVFSRSAGSRDHCRLTTDVARLHRVTGVVAGGGCALLALFAPQVVRVMFGGEFTDSAGPLRLLLPGVYAFTLFKILYSDAAGRGRPGLAVRVMLPAAIVNVALNFWWIPSFGISGSSLASSVSYVLATGLYMVRYVRLTSCGLRELIVPTRSDIEQILGMVRLHR